MNLLRRYKISKILNIPFKEQEIIDIIKHQLFLCTIYVDDKDKKICYCFNENMEYEAKLYVDDNKDMYWMKHYTFNFHLEKYNIIKDRNLIELVTVLYHELNSEYLNYKGINNFPYPTVKILERNFKCLCYSIEIYLSIINDK